LIYHGNTIMAQGNRGFAQGLAGAVPSPASGARLPPRTGILGARENRLAELTSGASITRVQELVDPARCQIWQGHNRDYAALNAANCADLIESFQAEGRQNFPAIVRRIAGDPEHSYEVICGARRHWVVSWMRTHGHPDFKFLVEPRDLSDEEAFRIADLENRSRRDISDYERARDYARAVERYYGGSQQRMAERLEVSKSWLSRYLELARLPQEVIAAFSSPHVIGISHCAVLAPLLRTPDHKDRIMAEAHRLSAEQAGLVSEGAPAIQPAVVMKRLVAARKEAVPSRKARNLREHIVRSLDGVVVARGKRAGRGGAVTINVPSPAKHERAVLLNAVEEILARIASRDRSSEDR
jgi:ParB family chromosome partitioning protein